MWTMKMKRDYKLTVVFITAMIFTTFLITTNHIQHGKDDGVEKSNLNSISRAGNDVVLNAYKGKPFTYKGGKDVEYDKLSNCSHVEFLNDTINPCWKSKYQRQYPMTCSARIHILGFPKCGTTDMAKWLHDHHMVSGAMGAYFRREDVDYNVQLTRLCPVEWVERDTKLQRKFLKRKDKLSIFNDCHGCMQISKVLVEERTHIVRRSALQYMSYIMTDNSRFIVTMRNPVERMVSHFFHVYQIKRPDNPYLNYTLDQVGNSFYHKLVSESVRSLTRCLKAYGTTICTLEEKLTPIKHTHPYLITMINTGCYSVYVREMIKFIPKDKIYFSKLEEYGADQAKAMAQIYDFVGLPPTAAISKDASDVKSKGYNSKPVLPQTLELLRTFYSPFNTELAGILGDKKWLWFE